MCSTATSSSSHLSSFIPQHLKPGSAVRGGFSVALNLPLHHRSPKIVPVRPSAGFLLEAPVARNDGSVSSLKLGGLLYGSGSVEDCMGSTIQNGTEIYYSRSGLSEGAEDLKKLIIENDIGCDRCGCAYPILEGLVPRRTENTVLVTTEGGVLLRIPASATGTLRRGLVVQMVANGGSEPVNMDSIYRAFDSCIRMASSSLKKIGIFNFFSNNNINFNGRQHIGPENPSGLTTEAGSGEDGRNGGLPPSGGSRGGGRGKDNNHGDDYDGQFSRMMKFVAEKMKEVAAEATKAEKAEAATKSMGTPELISRLALLVMSCLIFGTPVPADPSLLFKVCIATQIVIGSCFSTFEGLLGFVLATCACLGLMPTASGGFFGHVQRVYSSLPSSILKGGSPGFNISLKSDVHTYLYEGILFGTAGLGCGLICYAVVNLIRAGNGNAEESEEENLVSNIVKNSVRLGVFLLFACIPVIGLLSWGS